MSVTASIARGVLRWVGRVGAPAALGVVCVAGGEVGSRAALGAQALEAPRGDALDLLSVLPGGAGLIVVVDDADALAETAAGRAALDWVRSLEDFGETEAAWGELSAHLGLTEAEARERLLGRRFAMVVDRGEGADRERGGGGRGEAGRLRPREAEGEAAWAMVAVVDRSTAGLLRDRLGLSVRTVKGGQPVLLGEGGRVEVVLAEGRVVEAVSRVAGERKAGAGGPGESRGVRGRRAGNGAGGGGAGDVLLVAGPRSSPAVLDRIAQMVGGGEGVGSSSAVERPCRYLARLDEGVQFAIVADGPSGVGGARRLAVAGSVGDGGEMMRMVGVLDGEVEGAEGRGGVGTRRWSAGTFERFAAGSALAVIDSAVAFDFASSFAERTGDGAFAFGLRTAALERLVNGRLAAALYARSAAGADEEAGGRLDAVLAVETRDRVGGLALLDETLAALSRANARMRQLEGRGDAAGGAVGSGAGAGDEAESGAIAVNLGGAFPGTLRRTPMDDVFGLTRGFGSIEALGPAPMLGWTSRRADTAESGGRDGAGGGALAEGWIVLGVGSSERIRRSADGLSGVEGDGAAAEVQPWVSMGRVDLSALNAVFGDREARGGSGGTMRPPIDVDALSGLTGVSWRALRLEEGLIAGEAELWFVSGEEGERSGVAGSGVRGEAAAGSQVLRIVDE